MGYFYYYDWTYILFMIPCVIITLFAQVKVQSAYTKYSKVYNTRGMTGAQAAQYVLSSHGVTNVRIEPVRGKMTDHFDPRTNVIRLSEGVYNQSTIAAVGIACHEAGHAVQHAEGYTPNKIRSVLVPVANIGSKLSWLLITIGLIIPAFSAVSYSVGQIFLNLGIAFFACAVLFTIVTLPVEFNASSRALKCIRDNQLLVDDQYKGARSVLRAAAMTYVASALTAILQLVRLLLIVNRNSRR